SDLREAIAKEADPIDLELATRMGINLGPVRLVKDINGQPNIIGDGINVAQRVMSFAKPSQVLVSRSYYEVVSRLSEESSKLFTYEGSRTDKHIREHEVYGVGDVSTLHRRVEQHDSEVKAEGTLGRGVGAVSTAAKGAYDRLSAQPRLVTILAVAMILSVAIGGRMLLSNPEAQDTPPVDLARVSDEGPVAAHAASEAPAQRKSPDVKAVPRVAVAETKSVTTPALAPSQTQTKRTQVAVIPEPKAVSPEAKRTDKPASTAPAAEGEPATVTLAISPWGQVFVNGKMRGVSPPLQELELPPGKHRIEVKNDGSATHVVSLNAKPGERLKIKHKFN
ncbi:MAG: hypothetical protein ACXWCX_10035, partial [Burkholderiales bacterium]